MILEGLRYNQESAEPGSIDSAMLIPAQEPQTEQHQGPHWVFFRSLGLRMYCSLPPTLALCCFHQSPKLFLGSLTTTFHMAVFFPFLLKLPFCD